MVRIVPDDYFPTEGDGRQPEPSKGGLSTSSDTGAPAWPFSGLYTHIVEFGAPMDEALRAAIDNVTSLVLADKMEAAISAVEDAGLSLELVAINGTLLTMGANALLSVLAKPMELLFLELLRGGGPGDLVMAFQRALFRSTTTAAGGGVQEMRPDSAGESKALVARLWACLFSLDAVWRRYAEVAMVLVCLGLCLLIWLVRLRFAKYFDSLELRLSQQNNGTALSHSCQATTPRRESAPLLPLTREGAPDADMLPPPISYLRDGGDSHHCGDSGGPPSLSGTM
ncbi:uncharacterized protein Tco025E_02104 [Trypanosoma conorhini]|uniref:Uncharacterized protein n=1 Tax=Trypanosoma conorhini TaxID=83891 RepID=A0A3R7NQR0_9TRYP|nr:uncharacterized protein Tco025E_02104 [Trypanosoma conorhini]RNF25608.1 hypothetical protein Tco025E_02104 [Trypanosoma conorhini]